MPLSPAVTHPLASPPSPPPSPDSRSRSPISSMEDGDDTNPVNGTHSGGSKQSVDGMKTNSMDEVIGQTRDAIDNASSAEEKEELQKLLDQEIEFQKMLGGVNREGLQKSALKKINAFEKEYESLSKLRSKIERMDGVSKANKQRLRNIQRALLIQAVAALVVIVFFTKTLEYTASFLKRLNGDAEKIQDQDQTRELSKEESVDKTVDDVVDVINKDFGLRVRRISAAEVPQVIVRSADGYYPDLINQIISATYPHVIPNSGSDTRSMPKPTINKESVLGIGAVTGAAFNSSANRSAAPPVRPDSKSSLQSRATRNNTNATHSGNSAPASAADGVRINSMEGAIKQTLDAIDAIKKNKPTNEIEQWNKLLEQWNNLLKAEEEFQGMLKGFRSQNSDPEKIPEKIKALEEAYTFLSGLRKEIEAEDLENKQRLYNIRRALSLQAIGALFLLLSFAESSPIEKVEYDKGFSDLLDKDVEESEKQGQTKGLSEGEGSEIVHNLIEVMDKDFNLSAWCKNNPPIIETEDDASLSRADRIVLEAFAYFSSKDDSDRSMDHQPTPREQGAPSNGVPASSADQSNNSSDDGQAAGSSGTFVPDPASSPQVDPAQKAQPKMPIVRGESGVTGIQPPVSLARVGVTGAQPTPEPQATTSEPQATTSESQATASETSADVGRWADNAESTLKALGKATQQTSAASGSNIFSPFTRAQTAMQSTAEKLKEVIGLSGNKKQSTTSGSGEAQPQKDSEETNTLDQASSTLSAHSTASSQPPLTSTQASSQGVKVSGQNSQRPLVPVGMSKQSGEVSSKSDDEGSDASASSARNSNQSALPESMKQSGSSNQETFARKMSSSNTWPGALNQPPERDSDAERQSDERLKKLWAEEEARTDFTESKMEQARAEVKRLRADLASA